MVLSWLTAQLNSLPALSGWLIGLTLLISALGFYQLVYFVSIGYAFSMTVMLGVALAALWPKLDLLVGLQCLMLGIWSLRLGIFLLWREAQSGYQKTLHTVREQYQGGLKAKFMIWIGVSFLYFCMFTPVLFHLMAQPNALPGSRVFEMLGLGLMAAGLLVETLADRQKSQFKAHNPGQFCQTGLYRWVRYPNYLGEISLWVGSWLLGLPFYTSVLQVVLSLIGLTCIVLIMMGSTKRLETSQDERYGSLPEYQAYIRSVPVLFPFIPVYSLKNIRVYLE